MITHPNCKINIGLYVTSKRLDGYHNIETVFVPIPLCDDLEICIADEFQFIQDGIPIGGSPMNNLCVKAYNLLHQDFPNQMPPVSIHLTKVIPFGAGLGGGSSDAAFTLMMLNELCSLKLSIDQLEHYARRLGADCAFFIRNKPMFAYERGDVFSSIELNMTSYRIVLLKPSCGVSTSEAYRGLTPKPSMIDLCHVLQQPIKYWKNNVTNDFEISIFPLYPQIAELKDMLYRCGALYASMSGSGSSVFGLFPKDVAISLESIPSDTLSYILPIINNII